MDDEFANPPLPIDAVPALVDGEFVPVDRRYRTATYAGLGVADLSGRVEALLEKFGMLTRLGAAGVTEEKIPMLAAEAAEQWTAQFNPVEVGPAEFEALYRAAL